MPIHPIASDADYDNLDAPTLRSLIDQAVCFIGQEKDEIEKLNKRIEVRQNRLQEWEGILSKLQSKFAEAMNKK